MRRGRPPILPTPKEEARWAEWELKCRTTKEANRRLRQGRNRDIHLMRSQGMKWEAIASTFGITVGRAWQICNDINKLKQREGDSV